MNQEEQRIAEWLTKVKFKKQTFGGVSEQDVWKKISELNEMYKLAVAEERAKYNALVDMIRQRSLKK